MLAHPSGLPAERLEAMDNEYHLDYDQILNSIRNAEVVAFRFVTVPMRLLIDNRSNEIDPPMVKLVPRVVSAEERFKSLKMLRPRFKLPNKISAIWWPRYIASLEETGVWDALVKRIADGGFTDAAAECASILAELKRMERDEVANAIAGEGYRTLWPATR
ncbi:MAG: hypothetical protein WD359_10820 [Dehalococcoidia bacterium]